MNPMQIVIAGCCLIAGYLSLWLVSADRQARLTEYRDQLTHERFISDRRAEDIEVLEKELHQERMMHETCLEERRKAEQ
jgi:hypothetical protein